MKTKNDSPGVLIPPPLIYVLTFFASVLLQRIFPLSISFFDSTAAYILGWIFIAANIIFIMPALVRFYKSKNTLVLIKPANSLQTTGVYTLSRNPMYMGLLLLYSGLAFLNGNWWTVLCIPILVLIITNYIIKSEENYLLRAFGAAFIDYKKKVRRWI